MQSCIQGFLDFSVSILTGDGHTAQIDLRVLLDSGLGGDKAFLHLGRSFHLEAGVDSSRSGIKSSLVGSFCDNHQVIAGGFLQIGAI